MSANNVISDPFEVLNAETQGVEDFYFLDGSIAIFSSKSPYRHLNTEMGEEDLNQDCCAVIPLSKDEGVFAVADGMGGHKGGGLASKTAILALIETLRNYKNKDRLPVRAYILDALELAHGRIKSLGLGAGTTISIAEITKDHIRFYNVGDSICYLLGGKGLVKYKAIEHTPTGYAEVAGFIDEKAALTHEDNHLLLNALGLDNYRVEVSCSLEFSQRDLILIASDGLSSNIMSDDMIDNLTRGPVVERLSAIIDQAKQQMDNPKGHLGHPDDLTAILFRLTTQPRE